MMLLCPPVFVAVRFALYVPGVLYTNTGFCVVLSIVPSFSKSHAHAVGVFVEVSVNWTERGAGPDWGVLAKFATGGEGGAKLTTMKLVFTSLSDPPALVTVRFTE
jgi:hypothetical protein